MAPTSNPNAEQIEWMRAVATGHARWYCGHHQISRNGWTWERVRPSVVVPVVFGGFARYGEPSATGNVCVPFLTDAGTAHLTR